ncbi:MAG: hypothetical protein ABSG90_12760 [Dehalococcoidia bacterium]|jgi:hypothetical protein
MLEKLGLTIIIDIFKAIWKACTPSPQQKQKVEDEKKIDNLIDAVNSNDPGYKLPKSADKDKWGS